LGDETAGAGAEEADALGRSAAADGPAAGLDPVLLLGAFLEQPADPRSGAPSHVGDLLGRGRRQRVKVKLAVVAAEVHAVERQGVGVRVETQRGVEALDEGDGPGVSELDGAQAEKPLGAPPVAALHLLHEPSDHRRAQRSVVAHRQA
jgi:hypothetical protein